MSKRLSRDEWLAMQEARRGPMLADIRLACATWRWLQFPRHGAPLKPERALGSRLPEPAREWWMVYGRHHPEPKRPQPTPEGLDAIDRWLPAIMFKLEREERGALFGQLGLNLSFRAIGRMMGMSHETARRRFERALDVVERGRAELDLAAKKATKR